MRFPQTRWLTLSVQNVIRRSYSVKIISNIKPNLLNYKIGQILSAKEHPEADQLYVLELAMKEAEKEEAEEEASKSLIQVCSGLRKFIPLDQLINRRVVVVCNIKKAKMRGIFSEAMLLAASKDDKVELVKPPEGCLGEDLYFKKEEEEEEEKDNHLITYSKIKSVSKLKSCLDGVKSDNEGKVVFEGSFLEGQGGKARVDLCGGNIS